MYIKKGKKFNLNMIPAKLVFEAAGTGDINQLQQLLNSEQHDKNDIINAVNSYHHEEKHFITTPLGIAAKKGHEQCVNYLIEKCYADVNGLVTNNNQERKYFPPLWCAAANGHLDIVKKLVERGANIDGVVPHTGETPLRAACFTRKNEIINYLIRKGVDVEIADNSGFTCLMIASRMGSSNIVEYLVEVANAKVNKRDNRDSTALLCAAESHSLDTVIYLLKKGAALNVVDCFGNTPLTNAIMNGSTDIVDFLMPLVGQREQIDALELLGATYVTRKKYSKALDIWKKALRQRYAIYPHYVKRPSNYSPLIRACNSGLEEFTTEEELEAIKENLYYMLLQSLLIMERVLGWTNLRYAFIIKRLAYEYKQKFDIDNCLRFLMCYADIMQNIACLDDICLQAFLEILKLEILDRMDCSKKLARVFEMSVDYIKHEMVSLRNIESPSSEEIKNFDNSLHIPLYLIGIITNNIFGSKIEDFTKNNNNIKRLIDLKPKTISSNLSLIQLASTNSIDSDYGVIFPNVNITNALTN